MFLKCRVSGAQRGLGMGAVKAAVVWVAALSMLTVTGVAEASNYYLEDLGRFEEPQVGVFKENKIETTEEFLAASLTSRQRKVLSSKVKLTEAELLEFARDCELMQITGVGPRAAGLLRASGVESVLHLSESDPAGLLQRIKLVNAQERLTQKNPTLSVVKYWIAQAAKVPYRLR